jgi:hypothetical protein
LVNILPCRNTTLQTIAKKLPVTLAQLGEIDGIKKRVVRALSTFLSVETPGTLS